MDRKDHLGRDIQATRPGLIGDGWDAFRRCHAENAPADRTRELCLAYFFGARHIFRVMMATADMSEKDATRVLKRMQAELERFAHDVKQGDA